MYLIIYKNNKLFDKFYWRFVNILRCIMYKIFKFNYFKKMIFIYLSEKVLLIFVIFESNIDLIINGS